VVGTKGKTAARRAAAHRLDRLPGIGRGAALTGAAADEESGGCQPRLGAPTAGPLDGRQESAASFNSLRDGRREVAAGRTGGEAGLAQKHQVRTVARSKARPPGGTNRERAGSAPSRPGRWGCPAVWGGALAHGLSGARPRGRALVQCSRCDIDALSGHARDRGRLRKGRRSQSEQDQASRNHAATPSAGAEPCWAMVAVRSALSGRMDATREASDAA